MIHLFAFLLGGEVVWIRDFQNAVRKTIAYRDPWGYRWCRVYWATAVGHCVLLDDGKVDPQSWSSYVREWRPYRQSRALKPSLEQ